MLLWLVVAIVAAGIVLMVVVALSLRRRAPPAPPPAPVTGEDHAARLAREQELSELGQELIARRVELDARRGTLGGDAALDDALTQLEQRHRAGEISDAEFETEKVRLLGG